MEPTAASTSSTDAAGTPVPTGHRKRVKTTIAILRKAGKRGPSKARRTFIDERCLSIELRRMPLHVMNVTKCHS